MAKLYVNLPVTNVAAATSFYEALGFVKNPQFSNESASGMSYHDDFYLMLLSHNFTKGFLPATKEIADSHKTCEVLNALDFASREEVDAFYEKAIAAGGKEVRPAYDHGFMYGHDFEDLDGHIREPFWIDVSQMPPAQ